MKRIVKTSFLFLAMLGIMFTSCKKDYPEPPIQVLPIGTIYSIDSILKMESGTVFTQDASVYGIVTADEKSGNLYKAAFLQDRATGKAIELFLDATSGVRIGDSIRVYLKDVTYALYNGLPQLSGFEADGHIVILANDKPIEPAEATIADVIAGKYLGGLVKLNNVMFADKGTFADPTGYGNRTLVDPNDLSKSVIVRTSNYANFAKDSIPQGVGNLTAIASVYGQTWQLYIRSAKELEFQDYHPSGDESIMNLPYYQSFASSFGTYSTYDVSGTQSWVIDYSTAKMAGFENNVNYANEDWLISAPVNLEKANGVSMTMTYIARYFDNLNEDITIQVSEDYDSGDPNQATWTRVPASWTSGSDWNTFAQTTLDLSDFVGKVVKVAVKYVSTEKKAGTIEVQSIAIQEGNGPTPPPGPAPGGELQPLPYTQSFATEFGTYVAKDVLGAQSWIIDYKTAKMTGHEGGNPGTDYANEDWLISSPVDLSNVSGAMMTMSYIGRYFSNINSEITILVASDYVWDSDPSTASWTAVPASLKEGTNWNDFLIAEISLNEFVGQTVNVAVRYTSTDQDAGTIEIQSITIAEDGTGPTPPPGPTPSVQTLPYEQSFATEFGTYTTYDVSGAQSWMIDYSTAKMTGYVSNTNYANEDWLISAPVSLEGVQGVSMTMTYIARYFSNLNQDITLQVSSNYESGNPNAADWTQINASWTAGNDWNNFAETTVDLSNFVGQQVRVAIKYLSTSTKAGTIEVQSILIKEGAGPTPPPGPTPGGEPQPLPYYQSFASDFGTYITKDLLGPESWVIDYSTAKMTGFVNANESHANEDWLISSPVILSGVNEAKMTVEYIGRYFDNIDQDVTFWVSNNYVFNEDPSRYDWDPIQTALTQGSDWNNFVKTEMSLTPWVGQNVTIAVKYLSRGTRDSYAGTIEIKSITIEEGSAGDNPNPPTPPVDGEGSGTQEDPYNVASGINLQGQNVVAWVRGYIVGAVKSGTSTVTSNSDVIWSGTFDSPTNVVIADDPNCHDITQCVIVNLPSGKLLREQVNLVNNPDNYGLRLSVLGKLRTYFGQAGLRDSNGNAEDFVLEGYLPPTPPDPQGWFSESFMYDQGTFTIKNVILPEGLSYVWAHNAGYQCMKASSYVNDVRYATESWLVSPPIEIPWMNIVKMTFEQAVNYGSPQGMLSVMLSTDYTGDVTQATWTELQLDAWPSGDGWDFITSTADLSYYTNQTVVIAFKYTSTTSVNNAWEIKNLVIF